MLFKRIPPFEDKEMPTHRVNLDALIIREDFSATDGEETVQSKEPIFKVEDLESDRLYYSVLRKPDFQRTTDNWSSEMIVEFVKDFLDDELIPALIIWHSKKSRKVFVVDGAHRLSALIAWVNDDYGNGKISQEFFDYDIPKAQQAAHKKTKELIEKEIGSYRELLHLGRLGKDSDDSEKIPRGRAIATVQPYLQKVTGGAEKAQRAFLKINKNPAVIDATELDVIMARHKPNAIATRAIIRAGKGHKYWAVFGEENSNRIEELAVEIYNLLFGKLEDITTQSADVPRAGQPYSAEAFRMVLDIVNTFNNITDAMWKEPKLKSRKTKAPIVPRLPDDEDGTATIRFLENVKRVGELIGGSNQTNGSLGLDPAVYFYGGTGKFISGALVASLKFAQELRRDNKFFLFTSIRAEFEEFLVRNKSFINKLGNLKGARLRPVNSILTMFEMVMEKLVEARKTGISFTDDEILEYLQTDPQLEDLRKDDLGDDAKDDPNTTKKKKFSKSVKTIAVIQEVLNTRGKCKICEARCPPEFRSSDHITRQEDGGLGTLDNLQFGHPYCNTGYKEKLESEKKKALFSA